MKRLYELYPPKPNDKVVELKDENGFTLISEYPEGRDGVRMFIRLYVGGEDGRSLIGSVNRVSAEENHGGHSILNNEDKKGRVTNYVFFEDEGFKLVEGLVEHARLPTPVTIDDFVYFLIENHITDKLGLLRLRQYFSEKLVKSLFWLVDLKFNNLKLFDFEGSLRDLKLERDKKLNPEPFLKYFNVPRNMLGTIIVLTSFITLLYYFAFLINPDWDGKIKPPEVTNLLVVMYTASLFVILEFIANKINHSISNLDTKFNTSLGKKIALIYGFSRQKINLDFAFLLKKKRNF